MTSKTTELNNEGTYDNPFEANPDITQETFKTLLSYAEDAVTQLLKKVKALSDEQTTDN